MQFHPCVVFGQFQTLKWVIKSKKVFFYKKQKQNNSLYETNVFLIPINITVKEEICNNKC